MQTQSEQAVDSTMPERLHWLIEVAHGGSVNAAAKAIGVPQRTLAAAVRGEVKNPGMRLLGRIVAHHRPLGVTMDWLVEGRGPAPTPPRVPEAWRWASAAAAASVKWQDLLLELDLPEGLTETLLALPEQVTQAANEWGIIPRPGDGPVYLYAAQTMAFQTWATLFQGWVGEMGVAKVREALTPPKKKRPVRRG